MAVAEFQHPDRVAYIVSYDMVSVNFRGQVIVTEDQGVTVHGQVGTRDANVKMYQWYARKGKPVRYFPSCSPGHTGPRYIMSNNTSARALKHFPRLDWTLCESLPQGAGQRKNSQYTIGIATENLRGSKEDIINKPQNKKDNVKSGMLPQMSIMSELLDEVDNAFILHSTPLEREQRRSKWGYPIMREDVSLSEEVCSLNFLESLTAAFTEFALNPVDGDMIGLPPKKVGLSDGGETSKKQSKARLASMARMQKKFREEIGIDPEKYVFVSPHGDTMNGRGTKCKHLTTASKTVKAKRDERCPKGWKQYKRFLYAGSQRWATETADVREDRTISARDNLGGFLLDNPLRCSTNYGGYISRLHETSANRADENGLFSEPAHANKSVGIYSIGGYNIGRLRDRGVGLARIVEAASVFTKINGENKASIYFDQLMERLDIGCQLPLDPCRLTLWSLPTKHGAPRCPVGSSNATSPTSISRMVSLRKHTATEDYWKP